MAPKKAQKASSSPTEAAGKDANTSQFSFPGTTWGDAQWHILTHAILLHSVQNRPAIYATPGLEKWRGNGSDAINKRVQQAVKKFCDVYKAPQLVITSSKGKGGGGGGGNGGGGGGSGKGGGSSGGSGDDGDNGHDDNNNDDSNTKKSKGSGGGKKRKKGEEGKKDEAQDGVAKDASEGDAHKSSGNTGPDAAQILPSQMSISDKQRDNTSAINPSSPGEHNAATENPTTYASPLHGGRSFTPCYCVDLDGLKHNCEYESGEEDDDGDDGAADASEDEPIAAPDDNAVMDLTLSDDDDDDDDVDGNSVRESERLPSPTVKSRKWVPFIGSGESEDELALAEGEDEEGNARTAAEEDEGNARTATEEEKQLRCYGPQPQPQLPLASALAMAKPNNTAQHRDDRVTFSTTRPPSVLTLGVKPVALSLKRRQDGRMFLLIQGMSQQVHVR